MPQELQVLTCYQCETFQVQIVTKVRKWTCKMCGEKQSIKKIYFRGTGKECREIVQDLNARRLQMKEDQNYLALSELLENTDEQCENACLNADEPAGRYKTDGNKWSDLIENEEAEDDSEHESDQYTFTRESVKRKPKEAKVKEAYGYDDYSNAGFKRSKKENACNRSKKYAGSCLSENTSRENKKITIESKASKWAEDLENQSDEEINDTERIIQVEYSKKSTIVSKQKDQISVENGGKLNKWSEYLECQNDEESGSELEDTEIIQKCVSSDKIVDYNHLKPRNVENVFEGDEDLDLDI